MFGFFFFFFKQKTAYEIRKGDWSSDVCSSDLPVLLLRENREVGADPRGIEHQKSLADSVVTGSLRFCNAACSACHARFAHLMRLGNARTPENAASLPGAFAPPASISRKASNIVSASFSGFPFTASVISDAEAFEIAHPEPCGI